MKRYKELPLAFMLIAPLAVVLGAFIVVPAAGTLIDSFYRDVTFLTRAFGYFANYGALIADPVFWASAGFTLAFIAVSVPIEVGLGLMLALVLDVKMPGRGLLRGIVLVPWAIPVTVSARTWELIFNYSYGPANYLLSMLGVIHEPVNWLGTGLSAFLAVVVVDVWKTTPFAAIILLAGLQAIPRELYESGKVDGANFLQMFRMVTVPLLRPVLVTAVLVRVIDGLRVFDTVYVLTRGGPGGATTSVSLYAYKYFLSGDFGYGSAVSVMLFLVALGFAMLYLRIARFETE